MRYFLHLSYNGQSFHGWQTQQNAPSVQSCLEDALSRYLGENVALTGCGRTDAGVHAKDFWAHFDTEVDVKNASEFTYKINAILPHDVAVHGIIPVPSDAHARYHATSRTYRYYIRQAKEPFLRSLVAAPNTYHCSLDIAAMNQAAALLVGTHDFTSFSKLHTQTHHNTCTVTNAGWHTEPAQPFATQDTPLLFFEVTADRFLRNMVRCLVGSLLLIGKGRQPVEWILQVLQARDRSLAGHSVPPEGLYLWHVTYDNLNLTQ